MFRWSGPEIRYNLFTLAKCISQAALLFRFRQIVTKTGTYVENLAWPWYVLRQTVKQPRKTALKAVVVEGLCCMLYCYKHNQIM